MSGGAEWAQAGAMWASVIMGSLLTLLQIGIFWRLASWYMWERPGIDRSRPGPKATIRRLWCRHIVVARIVDGYGRNYTGCVQCAKDVNAGKPKEEWR